MSQQKLSKEEFTQKFIKYQLEKRKAIRREVDEYFRNSINKSCKYARSYNRGRTVK